MEVRKACVSFMRQNQRNFESVSTNFFFFYLRVCVHFCVRTLEIAGDLAVSTPYMRAVRRSGSGGCPQPGAAGTCPVSPRGAGPPAVIKLLVPELLTR